MKRERVLERIKTSRPDQWLFVRLRYELGGWNYFSGQRSERGYYLSVTPEEVRDGVRSFMMFSGIKGLVQPAARYSDRVLAALPVDQGLKERLIAAVVAKEGITLEGTRGIAATLPGETVPA